MSRRTLRVLPGFNLTLGYTLFYLSVIVLIPLSAVFIKTSSLGLAQFWDVVTAPRVLASYRLSFGASLLAASINAVFGLMLAWALVRYSFPGKKLVDALIDLPFALPTAGAGIALTALYAKNGWLGSVLLTAAVNIAICPPGLLVALVFFCLSGLYLRWPRQALNWRAWLTLDWAKKGRAFNWDLHAVAGTW